MKFSAKWKAAVVCAAMTFAMNAQAASGGLEIRLDASGEKSAQGSGEMRYSIRNLGSESVLVLRWETALNGVDDDLFDVRANGNPVEYVGKHFKRPRPTAADYIVLLPGESRSATVDLTEHYAMRSAGQYHVRARGEFSQAFVEGSRSGMKSALEFRAATPTSMVWIDGAHVAAEPDLSWLIGAKAGSVSFVGCSNTRASAITTAVGSSKTYAANAKGYLAAGTVGARYTTWFGTYTSSRYSTVRSHFNNIDSALNNQALVFDCSCTDSAYAYVYPTQPYKIYLCNAFWSAPNTGTDSRAGTIIHETSHFNVVAGTQDYAYGQTAAKSLATRTPNKAVNNADSHEYFAENTPFQN